MIDPFAGDYEQNIDPIELKRTLAGFLGQTYQEISKYDTNLVSANQFLAPKKEEFHRIAEKVLREVNPSHNQAFRQQPNQHPIQQVSQQPINHGIALQQAEPHKDPNQLEFSFDNSVTAITINNKLNDIEKRLKKLDYTLDKVLSLLGYDDTEDSK